MTARDNAYRAGSGRTGVLLIHGLCGSPSEMRFLAGSLARQGYTVLCPELAGHGGASRDLQQTTWHDWLDSARDGLAELSLNCDRVIVGGLSTGALLALMLAAESPDKVDGIALYSPTFWLNGRKVPWALRLARLCLSWRPIARRFSLPSPVNYGIKDDRIRELVAKSLARPGGVVGASTPAVTALERRSLAKKVLGLLGGIRHPALIVHPREDCLADLDNAFHLQKNLGGRAELLVLDDSYHLVTIDRQRQAVADATGRFLASLEASLAPARMTGARTAAA